MSIKSFVSKFFRSQQDDAYLIRHVRNDVLKALEKNTNDAICGWVHEYNEGVMEGNLNGFFAAVERAKLSGGELGALAFDTLGLINKAKGRADGIHGLSVGDVAWWACGMDGVSATPRTPAEDAALRKAIAETVRQFHAQPAAAKPKAPKM